MKNQNKKCPVFLIAILVMLVMPLTTSICWSDNKKPSFQIKAEKTKNYDSTFITPNEFQVNPYAQILNNKTGAFIGVGSFRLFNNSQHGNFQTIISLDYSNSITGFNRELAEILLRSENRNIALARVLQIEPEDLSKKAWSPRFYQWLFSQVTLEDEDTYGREGLPRALWNWKNEHPRQWKSTIFGSDENFKKAKERSKEGKYVFVTGNLIGSVSMTSIARSLKASRIPVTAIDLSNSLEYFNNKTQFQKLASNIQQLPLSKDAVVLLTLSFEVYDFFYGEFSTNKEVVGPMRNYIENTFQRSKDSFIYLSMPAKEFILFIKKIQDKKSLLPALYRLLILKEKNLATHHPTLLNPKCILLQELIKGK
ncbi:MAG: hypothetical protein IPM57_04025 [Oligoflexia bacterium]|nr:hypothetical protein [Oligoflexia bacterium]